MTLKSLKIRRFYFFGGGGWGVERLLSLPEEAAGYTSNRQTDSPPPQIVVYGTAEAPHSPSPLSAKKAGNLKFPRFLFTLCGCVRASFRAAVARRHMKCQHFSWHMLECFVKQKFTRWSDRLDAVFFVTNKWQGTRQGHGVHTVYVRIWRYGNEK